MVAFNYLDVKILQEGILAREYEDPATESGEDTTTKYIEILEDRPFAICFATGQDFDFEHHQALAIAISIDGKHAGTSICFQDGDSEKDGQIIRQIQGIYKVINGRNSLKQFRFEEARLRKMRSNETLNQLREQFEDHGTICVEVFRCTCDNTSDEESNDEESNDEESSDEETTEIAVPKDIVKEKGSTSKASSIIVETPFSPASYTSTKVCFVARFRLKYRTIEALYDQKIVPRPEKDVATLITENEILLAENEELRKKLKKESGAEQAGRIASEQRKLVEYEEFEEIEVTLERPAHRRKPNADDVVIELDD